MARETSAGAVVFRQSDGNVLFLLLHYTAGHWDFPKGNIEQGEEERITVQREIEEETGIRNIAFIDSFRDTIRYSYTWKGLYINKVVRVYLAETDHAEVKLSREHQAYEWLSYDDAFERLTYDNSKNVLERSMTAIAQKYDFKKTK